MSSTTATTAPTKGNKRKSTDAEASAPDTKKTKAVETKQPKMEVEEKGVGRWNPPNVKAVDFDPTKLFFGKRTAGKNNPKFTLAPIWAVPPAVGQKWGAKQCLTFNRVRCHPKWGVGPNQFDPNKIKFSVNLDEGDQLDAALGINAVCQDACLANYWWGTEHADPKKQPDVFRDRMRLFCEAPRQKTKDKLDANGNKIELPYTDDKGNKLYEQENVPGEFWPAGFKATVPSDLEKITTKTDRDDDGNPVTVETSDCTDEFGRPIPVADAQGCEVDIKICLEYVYFQDDKYGIVVNLKKVRVYTDTRIEMQGGADDMGFAE